MQPHEQRVLDEKQALDEKLEKLVQFISVSPVFASLDSTDQSLLRDQRIAMADYSLALSRRIERFAP